MSLLEYKCAHTRPLSRLFAVVLAAAALNAAPWIRPAQAAFEADPRFYRGWDVSGFEIRGLEDDLKDGLKEGLALAGDKKLLWTDYPRFSPEMMEADIQRARLYLSRNGRPDASVGLRFEGDTKDRSVKVIFEIEPGRVVRIASTATEAFPPRLEPRARRLLELDQGQVFSDQLIERRVGELLHILQTSGYAKAKITTSIEFPDSTHARVSFMVKAGEIYRFGDTVIRGIDDDLVEIAKRSVAIEPGTLYSPEPLASAAENLRLLDLFRRVGVTTEDSGRNRLRVVATLAERKPQSVQIGVGYWTEDQFRLTASWRHRNLFKGGRGLNLEGTYSRFVQTAALLAWKPVLFHSRTRGSIQLQGRREDEENYRLLSGEVETAATYLASMRTTLRGAVAVAIYDLTTKSDSAGTYRNPGPNLLRTTQSWSRNHLNDRLYPTSGTLYRIASETGWPGFDFGKNYTLLEPVGLAYVSPLDGLVLASRLAIGYALPAERSRELLPNKRFYSGGANSMRGYQRRRLGPRDSGGKPIGGIGLLESSAEIRFPILWRIHGAIFCDAAQVWDERSKIRPLDLELAIGPGLLMLTPVGPIRVDVGFPITPIPGSEPSQVYHLSVGQAY